MMNADELAGRLEDDLRYRELVARRSRFGAILALSVIIVYFGFILLVAFARSFLAAPIAGGATSWGIPIGVGVILYAFAATAIYVRRANGIWDREMASILNDAHAAEDRA